MLAGLLGAILWNLITWYYGIPVSSSHALIGGYAGAAVAKAGWGAIIASGWTKTLIFIVLAPLIGMVLGFGLMAATTWLLRHWNPFRLDKLVPAAAAALRAASTASATAATTPRRRWGSSPGSSSPRGTSQKFEVPLWVILISHAAIAFGTMFGGWRIVKTMGSKITKLQPFGGFCAETSGALTLDRRHAVGHPGLDDPHDHRGDRRGGRHQAAFRGEVGRRGADRLGLGAHHPAGRGDVGDQLPPAPPARLAQAPGRRS